MLTVQENLVRAWNMSDSGMMATNVVRRETEGETQGESLAATVALITEGNQLVLLQVNCRSIYSKCLGY